MIDILTLPDLFERRFYKIELVTGSKPTFEAGEMVDLLWNSTLNVRTIRKITGDPVGTPVPVFQDTKRRDEIGDVLASGGTTVIEGAIDMYTDKFVDAMVSGSQNDPLTVDGGEWKKAVSGKTVYGRLLEVPSAISAQGGEARIKIADSPHVLA